MRCPTCNYKKTTIIRTRPDPDSESTDHVRQCRNPACLAIFNSRETVINTIDLSTDREIVTTLASLDINAVFVPQALARAGGLEAIRGEIIDDCALARAVKGSGGKVWLGVAADTVSLRRYRSFAEIGRIIARTAFSQLRHSTLLLLAALLGLAVIYLLPSGLLFAGAAWPRALGAVAWAAMTLAYLPMVRFYGLNPLWALGLPLTALFYMGATLESALKYWSGRGGEWKGRVQDPV